MAARAPFALTPYLLLARILLFLVFIPAGAQKLMTVEFHGEEAARIKHLLEPPPAEPKVSDSETTPAGLLRFDADDAQSDTYKAKSLYSIALVVEDAGWGSPVLFAWIASCTMSF